jgi:protein-S-isoprenylcysteine O-methyltransferase Ste14
MLETLWSLRLFYVNILCLVLSWLLFGIIKAKRMVGPGNGKSWGIGFWLIVIAGWAMTWFVPFRIDLAFWTGLGIIAAGMVVHALSFDAMREHPEKKRAVVDWGIYRASRHPQTLGGIICLLGVVVIGWNTSLAIYPALWIYLASYIAFSHFEILSEEKANLQRFGPEYKEYMDRTPRYLGLPGSGAGGKRY